MRSIGLATTLALLLCQAVTAAQTSRGLTGTWIGTFNGQPDPGPDETMTPFKLTLRRSAKSITGLLVILSGPPRSSEIKKGVCDPEGCSFEVLDYGDDDTPSAWRVWIENGKLLGMHNRGPLGPLGIGIGARLFRIEAKHSN